ncbi:MAG: hypothetical protein K6G83_04535 [Lachnospiraceae bacterium]|nr:hypothetical protein [Lachnospiraceae bacterium]
MNDILKTILIVVTASCTGLLLLCMVYLIPNRAVSQTRDELFDIMEEETPGFKDTRFFTYAYGSKNMPDSFIYRLAAEDQSKPLLYRVVGGPDEGDNRYWDGFMVLVIPLMTFLSWGQIRFLFTLVTVILIWYILVFSRDRLPWYYSFSFAVGLLFINMHVNFYSIMLDMIFLVSFGFMIYILKTYTVETDPKKLFYVFLIDGILTTYLDRYTASLLSLELPLFIIVMINIYEDGAASIRRNWKNILFAVSGWGIGFSFFWLNKWIIASGVLGKNVLSSAAHQARGRAMTNASEMLGEEVENVGGRWFTIAKNISSLLPTHGEHIISLLLIVAGCLLVMAILFAKRKGRLSEPVKYLPLLALMLMPYVYYFILSDLNQVHATFFMYRMQLPVIMGVFMLYFDGLTKAGNEQ